MEDFTNIVSFIENAKNIIITGHTDPDPDAICSSLALALALKKKYDNKKSIKVVFYDKIPKNVLFLDKISLVEEYKENLNTDLLITLDSSTLERVSLKKENIKKDFKILNIDHHISNTYYGDVNLIKNVSSTCEIIYNFIKYLDIEIDKSIASSLYAGLIFDTGNFSHSNVTSDTFLMASNLIKYKIDNSKITNKILIEKTRVQFEFIKDLLSNMHIIEEKLIYYFLPYSLYNSLEGEKSDYEGLVTLLNSYENSEVAVFIRGNKDGSSKVSLRSKYSVDVLEIAKHFGGGGHRMAAGFTARKGPEYIIEKIIKIMRSN